MDQTKIGALIKELRQIDDESKELAISFITTIIKA